MTEMMTDARVPHRCPGSGCAVCRWLMRQWWRTASNQEKRQFLLENGYPMSQRRSPAVGRRRVARRRSPRCDRSGQTQSAVPQNP